MEKEFLLGLYPHDNIATSASDDEGACAAGDCDEDDDDSISLNEESKAMSEMTLVKVPNTNNAS